MSVILGLFLAVLALFITYYKWRYQYWKRRNLKYIEPTIPFGSFGNSFTRKIAFSEILKNFYDDYKRQGEKHVGFYMLANPAYFAIDLELIKNILTKDFSYFADRGMYYDEKRDPLSAHLFNLAGTKWRNLRVKLTPTFTSGKMKMMFNTLVECGNLFKEAMNKFAETGEPVDIKEALGCFTTDVIGSCAFGLECNSINNTGSPFRKYGKMIFERTKLQNLINSIAMGFPKISKFFGFRSIPKEVSDFYMNVVKDTVQYREKYGIIRNDFMQILIDLKNNKFTDNSLEDNDGKTLTIEEIAAQCFVFFIAGFETSSTVMTFALLELSRNPDVQDRARREVVQVMNKYNGQLTYEGLMEMKYLNQIVDESMRMYPPVPLLIRRCLKDYVVPDTGFVLEKGTRVIISTLGIQRDPEYYEDADKFNPENFSEENKKKRHPYAFLPFGEGPRICIGLRFGYMQSKVGLAILLKNFKFSLNNKTKTPIKLSQSQFITAVEGGVWLNVENL